jgi:long-chain fatty acid transport protein
MKTAFKKVLLCLGLASSVCVPTTDVHAVFASVKSTGMAAAAVAYPQDALAGAFNPAGMVDVGDRIDSGFAAVRDSRKLKIHGNGSPLINGKFDANHHAKWVYTGDFGINKQFGCNGNMSIGLVVYNRNYNKVKYKNPQPIFSDTKPLGMEYVHETVAPTFAVKLWEKHNFGISVNWMIQRLWVQGIQKFDNPMFSKFPGHVTNHRYNYSQGCSVTFGYRCQISDNFSVGVTAQPRTYMRPFRKYRGFLNHAGRLHIPPKIAAGFAWRFDPRATLAFDVEWINWKRVKALTEPLQQTTADLIEHKLGSAHGTGFGFRDQWFYRLGVDYDLTDSITVRAGYRYANTPIRRTQTAVNALICDTVESFVTVGASYCINPCNEVSVLYAHGFRHKVKGQNSIPPEFGGGNADLKQYTDVFGISWGHTY